MVGKMKSSLKVSTRKVNITLLNFLGFRTFRETSKIIL